MGPTRQFRLFLLFSGFLVASLVTQGAAQSRFTGTVTDAAGDVMPRVAVRLVDASGRGLATTFTDSRGEFHFDGPCDACAATVSLPGFNDAQSPLTGAAPIRLALTVAPIQESVVVTPTRNEAPASQAGAALTVFTEDEIARRDVPMVGELLHATPGATLVTGGGRGGVTSLFVRGGESGYNKVLLDGIPLNEPGGTFNFNSLTTDFVERVEVIRGAQSALFGSDAMTSVVQVITKHAPRGASHPTILASAETGSYAARHASTSLGAARGVWDGALHVGGQHTANRAPNNAYGSTTIAANGGFTPTGDLSIRFVARRERGRVGVPGATAFGRPDLDAFFTHRHGVGGATLDYQMSDRWQHRATYALTTARQQSTNLGIDPEYVPQFGDRRAPFAFGDFPYDSLTQLHRHYATYQIDGLISRTTTSEQQVTFAFDVNAERGVLTDRLAASIVHATRNNVGWTVQHQWLGPRVSLSTGLRIEHNGSFGTATAPRVSLAFVASPQITFKANAGLGVKEPTILQSFSPSPFFLGNPDLEPERATTVDAGIEQRWFRQRFKVDAVWFYGRFRDIISTRTTSFSPFRAEYFNVGLTTAQGVEVAVEGVPSTLLRLRGGYTLLVSRIGESTAPGNTVFEVGSWAFRRPRHAGFVEAIWARNALTADLRGTFVGRRVDSDFSSLEPPLLDNPGYTTWASGVGIQVSSQASIYLRLDNLANRDYMEPLGYPAWKRSARVGVRLAW